MVTETSVHSSARRVAWWGWAAAFGVVGGASACVAFLGTHQRSSFVDTFDRTTVIEETGSIDEGDDSGWWLNSGARLHIRNGVARTIVGELPKDDVWRLRYEKSNPIDSDGGARPQNVFRLVTRDEWTNVQEELVFRILRVNLSSSPQRDEWSGIFLFSRYQDGDNLYYAGLRFDGDAVIKKKQDGRYTTLAEKPVYRGTYDRTSNPNLLPVDRLLGLRATTTTLDSGAVEISLSVRDPLQGNEWTRVATAIDRPGDDDGDPILDAGHGGIRTDFMDAEFTVYTVESTREGGFRLGLGS